MTVKNWLNKSEIEQLDGQLLLSFILDKPKEWLLAHDDFVISSPDFDKLEALKKRRQGNEPMAYILGKKEFFRRDFIVTPDVLIPRPETEQLVEYCLSCPAKKILDVGTGSACIAITLKIENPKLEVTASDISEPALKIAEKNWQGLKKPDQEIRFIKSDLLEDIKGKYDVIVANLPYVDKAWHVSPETQFEPQTAIFAEDKGVSLIKKLIDSAHNHLEPSGLLVLELDPKSVEQIKKHNREYTVVHEKPFVLVFRI